MEYKIYTRKGDAGETSLIGGRRVPKYDLQIEAYGTVDELNSFIGVVRDGSSDPWVRTILLEVQDRLFTMESLLADDKTPLPDSKKRPLPQLSEGDVRFLEDSIDGMEKTLPPLTSFVLPGGHPLGSWCHVARTVCRRAERIVLHLSRHLEVDPLVIRYLNRLSDFLFVLARKLTLDHGGEEIPWRPRV